MSKPIYKVKGKGGQIELYENRLIIKRKGITGKLSHMGKGEKEIRISDITGIQFKKPGLATNGYIQIGQSGYSESDGGVFSAAGDENSVMFARKQHKKFAALRDKINELRDRHEGGISGMSERDPALDALRSQFANGEINEKEYNERLKILG